MTILIVFRDDKGVPFTTPRALVGEQLVTLTPHPNGWELILPDPTQ